MDLQKVPKPKNTPIVVNKSLEKLEIYLQPLKNPVLIMIGDGLWLLFMIFLWLFFLDILFYILVG